MGKVKDKGISEDELDGVTTHVRHINRNEDKSHERSASSSDSRRKSVDRNRALGQNDQSNHDSQIRNDQTAQHNFYVLILSKKQAKFFKGDLAGLHHIEIGEMPNGIADVVHLEEKDDKNLFRAGGSGGSAGGFNFHGMGAGVPSDKENIAMYLKEVDRTLWKSGLNQDKVPMVLGGVEYIVAMFKDISQYKHIEKKSLIGSFENEDPKVIYEKARDIVNPVVE